MFGTQKAKTNHIFRNSIKNNRNRKNNVPLKTSVLLYKSGVRGGLNCMDLLTWWQYNIILSACMKFKITFLSDNQNIECHIYMLLHDN